MKTGTKAACEGFLILMSVVMYGMSMSLMLLPYSELIMYFVKASCKSNDLGKLKISVDGVFARVDELQKTIRLSELPLAGKIRAVYQTIGSKTEAPRAVGDKRKKMVDQPQGSRRPE